MRSRCQLSPAATAWLRTGASVTIAHVRARLQPHCLRIAAATPHTPSCRTSRPTPCTASGARPPLPALPPPPPSLVPRPQGTSGHPPLRLQPVAAAGRAYRPVLSLRARHHCGGRPLGAGALVHAGQGVRGSALCGALRGAGKVPGDAALCGRHQRARERGIPRHDSQAAGGQSGGRRRRWRRWCWRGVGGGVGGNAAHGGAWRARRSLARMLRADHAATTRRRACPVCFPTPCIACACCP